MRGQREHAYQTYNWRDSDEVPLLGLGPSAYSYVAGCQYYNTNDLDEYRNALAARTLPVFRGEVLEPQERWRRSCVLGLKVGIDLEELARVYGDYAKIGALQAATEPLTLGLLSVESGRMELTPTGSLLADEVARCFSSDDVRSRTHSVESASISTTSRKLNH
jgi:coproporphyrinogen III oxidase-like Fe-S oxidoreductase